LQNNPDNIYFQKINEFLADDVFTDNVVARLALLVPEFGYILRRVFSVVTNIITLINTKLLPLISKKQLGEPPAIWFANRLHNIVEQRLETPTSQNDLLQLMLQAVAKKVVNLIATM
jgi:hypothetical protein